MPGRALGRSSSAVSLRGNAAAGGVSTGIADPWYAQHHAGPGAPMRLPAPKWASAHRRGGYGGGQPPGAAYLAFQSNALPSNKERAMAGSTEARHRELMHERERYLA